MSPTATRLDPRIRRTRHSIQQAFEQLLSDRGLAALTVQDITTQAGINRATFYAHYEDKYALFSEVIQDHLDATLAQRLTRPLRFDNEGLSALLIATCVFMTQVYEGCHVHDKEMEVNIGGLVHQRLNGWLLESLERSQPAPNSRLISQQMTARLTASLLYSAASDWGQCQRIQGQTICTLEVYAENVMVFVLGGVRASGFQPLDIQSLPKGAT